MQLESYKDLDTVFAEAAAERDKTAEAHRTFLANESIAGKLQDREKLFDAARLATAELGEALAAASAEPNRQNKMTIESVTLRNVYHYRRLEKS